MPAKCSAFVLMFKFKISENPYTNFYLLLQSLAWYHHAQDSTLLQPFYESFVVKTRMNLQQILYQVNTRNTRMPTQLAKRRGHVAGNAWYYWLMKTRLTGSGKMKIESTCALVLEKWCYVLTIQMFDLWWIRKIKHWFSKSYSYENIFIHFSMDTRISDDV